MTNPTKGSPIRDFVAVHYAWLVKVGWAGKRTPLEDLALIASEVGEAANECRGDKPLENFGEELADIVLRVFGTAYQNNIDIEAEILKKMEKNDQQGNKGRIK